MDKTKVVSTVEGVRLAASQQGRVQITLSFANGGNEHVLGFFARFYKQSVELSVEAIQASLLDDGDQDDEPEAIFGDPMEPAAETETMIVDGVEAPVRRPGGRRRNGNSSDAWPAHAFEENPEKPGLCRTCNHRPEDNAHATEDERPLPHPFARQAGTDACDVCGLVEANQLHDEVTASTGNSLADKLIEDANSERQPAAAEDEAAERAQAEANLAAAGAAREGD